METCEVDGEYETDTQAMSGDKKEDRQRAWTHGIRKITTVNRSCYQNHTDNSCEETCFFHTDTPVSVSGSGKCDEQTT